MASNTSPGSKRALTETNDATGAAAGAGAGEETGGKRAKVGSKSPGGSVNGVVSALHGSRNAWKMLGVSSPLYELLYHIIHGHRPLDLGAIAW